MKKIGCFIAVFSFLPVAIHAATLPPSQGAPKPAMVSPLENKNPSTINLNQADAKTLMKSMKGIGNKRAEAIVKYRESNGPFKTVDELAKVPGLKRFVHKHLQELESRFVLS